MLTSKHHRLPKNGISAHYLDWSAHQTQSAPSFPNHLQTTHRSWHRRAETGHPSPLSSHGGGRTTAERQKTARRNCRAVISRQTPRIHVTGRGASGWHEAPHGAHRRRPPHAPGRAGTSGARPSRGEQWKQLDLFSVVSETPTAAPPTVCTCSLW